jgi:hypothetical protein
LDTEESCHNATLCKLVNGPDADCLYTHIHIARAALCCVLTLCVACACVCRSAGIPSSPGAC